MPSHPFRGTSSRPCTARWAATNWPPKAPVSTVVATSRWPGATSFARSANPIIRCHRGPVRSGPEVCDDHRLPGDVSLPSAATRIRPPVGCSSPATAVRRAAIGVAAACRCGLSPARPGARPDVWLAADHGAPFAGAGGGHVRLRRGWRGRGNLLLGAGQRTRRHARRPPAHARRGRCRQQLRQPQWVDQPAGRGSTVDAPLDDVCWTGSHAASLDAVRDGRAVVASIDAVSWAHLDHAGLSVVGSGPRVPCLPLVTSASSSDALVDELRGAFASSSPIRR